MKFHHLLCCLVWGVSSALAYDLYGGYERMLYYYAYRMDYAKNGKAKNVGAGCKSAAGANSPCDIYDFVAFINQDGKRPVLKNLPANFNANFPDTDWTARALRDAGSTGIYNCNKIYGTLGRNDVEGAFKKVAEFVGGAREAKGVDDTMRTGTDTAVDRVANLRQAANLEAFGKELQTKFGEDKVVTRDWPIGNTGETAKTIDPAATRDKIRAIKGQEKWSFNTELAASQARDPGHADKVKMAASCKKLVRGERVPC